MGWHLNRMLTFYFCLACRVAVAYSGHRGAGHYFGGGTVHHEEHQEQWAAHCRVLMLQLNTTTANGNEALCKTSVSER